MRTFLEKFKIFATKLLLTRDHRPHHKHVGMCYNFDCFITVGEPFHGHLHIH